MTAKERIHSKGMKLVAKVSGEWLRTGHIICDVYGETHVIYDGDCPKVYPPNGRVRTTKGTYPPANLHTEWREMDQVEAEVARLPSVQLN